MLDQISSIIDYLSRFDGLALKFYNSGKSVSIGLGNLHNRQISDGADIP